MNTYTLLFAAFAFFHGSGVSANESKLKDIKRELHAPKEEAKTEKMTREEKAATSLGAVFFPVVAGILVGFDQENEPALSPYPYFNDKDGRFTFDLDEGRAVSGRLGVGYFVESKDLSAQTAYSEITFSPKINLEVMSMEFVERGAGPGNEERLSLHSFSLSTNIARTRKTRFGWRLVMLSLDGVNGTAWGFNIESYRTNPWSWEAALSVGSVSSLYYAHARYAWILHWGAHGLVVEGQYFRIGGTLIKGPSLGWRLHL